MIFTIGQDAEFTQDQMDGKEYHPLNPLIQFRCTKDYGYTPRVVLFDAKGSIGSVVSQSAKSNDVLW